MTAKTEAENLAELSESLAEDGALLHCWPWPSLAKLFKDDAAELRRLQSEVERLTAALAAERERCARVIEGYPHWIGENAKREIAAAIRAEAKGE